MLRGYNHVERATRRFYKRLIAVHAIFTCSIQGIPDEEMKGRYASAILHRLMFVYFIQKKRFLNGDEHYLRNQLTQGSHDNNGFYRDFLYPLFYQGFARPAAERSEQISRRLGNVPYLSSCLFQPHPAELTYGKNIQIADTAFERVFAFFDQYLWRLDERALLDDHEISPDVFGNIFEKYVNQKEMGAYYTEEDITGYIGKYTILPYLLEQARKNCPGAFSGPHSVWRFLAANPRRYIYPAVQKGAGLPLPEEIQAGVADVSQRSGWNQTAPEAYALPTETWREVITRRERYAVVYQKLSGGEICTVNDLITYNLDIQRFALDVVQSVQEPELACTFWVALHDIKILDPTCGSGAFLFSALTILEPLYEACLARLQSVESEADQPGEKHRPERFSDFRKTPHPIEAHLGRRSLIDKSIITNNLYGVDIMEEAAEICKLRLFLKLIAQIDTASQIELLADIDFNIRLGNALDRPVDFGGVIDRGGFDVIISNPPYIEYSQARQKYDLKGFRTLPAGNLYAFVIERSYSLLQRNGFLSMIVQLPMVCTDRMAPLQKLCLELGNTLWFSTYDDRPARLFADLEHIRAAIFISSHIKTNKNEARVFSSGYQRWYTEQRSDLFELIHYEDVSRYLFEWSIPKIGSEVSKGILDKIRSHSALETNFCRTGFPIYYHNSSQYWVRATNYTPYFWNERGGEQVSKQVKRLCFQNELDALCVMAMLNSSLFYLWFILLSDCRHLNRREIENFPAGLDRMDSSAKEKLAETGQKLVRDYRKNARRKSAYYMTTGQVEYDEYYPGLSKPIIDEIDRILARHFGFTPEEIDFIIGFDVRYRTGGEQ